MWLLVVMLLMIMVAVLMVVVTVLIMVAVSVVTMVPLMMVMVMMSMVFVVSSLELSRFLSAVDIHGLLLLGLVGLCLLDQTHACRERENRNLGYRQLHVCSFCFGGSDEKKERWYKI